MHNVQDTGIGRQVLDLCINDGTIQLSDAGAEMVLVLGNLGYRGSIAAGEPEVWVDHEY